jgi:hypothetical protein
VRDLLPLIQLIREHILLMAGFCVVGLMFLGWALIEAFRSGNDGDDTMRVRQRLYELERDTDRAQFRSPDPVVLSRRWARSGSACTSTDGGCFLIVDRVVAPQRSAFFTVRVDGLPVFQGHALRCGETLNLPGRSGTYNLQLWAVDGAQAAVSISLRTGLDNLSASTGD